MAGFSGEGIPSILVIPVGYNENVISCSEKELQVFATNSNIRIPLSLQLHGVKYRTFLI